MKRRRFIKLLGLGTALLPVLGICAKAKPKTEYSLRSYGTSIPLKKGSEFERKIQEHIDRTCATEAQLNEQCVAICDSLKSDSGYAVCDGFYMIDEKVPQDCFSSANAQKALRSKH